MLKPPDPRRVLASQAVARYTNLNLRISCGDYADYSPQAQGYSPHVHETSESGGLDLALVIRSLGDSESSILVDHASILMHAGSTKEKLAMATEMAKTEEPNIDDWLFEKGLEDQSRVSDIKQSLAEQISAALAEEGVSKAELRYSGTGRLDGSLQWVECSRKPLGSLSDTAIDIDPGIAQISIENPKSDKEVRNPIQRRLQCSHGARLRF